MSPTFAKHSAHAPKDYFAWEAAGLDWLADAEGAQVVTVVDVSSTTLTLDEVESVEPSRNAAADFGRGLAVMHAAGAAAFGAAPDGYDGPGFFGPLERPLPMTLGSWPSYGEFYAQRLEEMRMHCGSLADPLDAKLRAVCDRLRSGTFDDTASAPARVHGDLWSGNLMWSAEGVVLIDPAAHGGHRETDLAMLHLFGCPYLESVISGYLAAEPLPDGWRDRIPLHQLYPLLAHVALFGGGYAAQTSEALDRTLALG